MERKIKIQVFSLLFLVVACGHAQDKQQDMGVIQSTPFQIAIDSSYSFVCYDANQLIFPGDSAAFRQFADKWNRVITTGRGKINIMHLGASHVQGGTFPHRIRRDLLLTLANDNPELIGARGMLFPYSAAIKCNNPFDYKVYRSHPLTLTRNVYREPDQQLGLCGIAVTATDSSAEIGITLADPDITYGTNRIVLFGQSYGGVVPQLKLYDTVDNLFSKAVLPVKVDTVLRRYLYQLPYTVDSFHILLPCDSGQAFAVTGLYLDNGIRSGVSYHSIGVNGAATTDYLEKCPYFTTDLRIIKPDLVIFGIGINDASGPNFDTMVFRQRYQQLVDSIRSISPECTFVFVTNNDSYRHAKRHYTVNNNGPLVRDAFVRLARDNGAAVWDQFSVMGGLKSMEKWYENGLAQRDRVHFTRAGYNLLGDLFSMALLQAIQEFTCASEQSTNVEQNEPLKKKQQSDSGDARFNYISY